MRVERLRWRAILGCAAVLCALAPAVAGAQGMDQAKDRARALANQGYELFDAGQYDKAIEKFREAEQSFHAPTILLMIARANVKLGRLVEARVVYQRISGEQLQNYAPAEFFEAQRNAKTELAALDERIPTLQVSVTGAQAGEAQVTVDGKPAADGGAAPMKLNPGRHEVSASAPGQAPVTEEVTLAEGASERVEISLGAAAGAPSDGSGGDPGPDEAAGRGSLLPAAIAFGVGGVGLGIGLVTGALTLGKVGELEDACPGGVCARSEEGTYDSAHTLATVSTIGFVVAGLGAAAGAVLFVVRPGGGGEPATTGVVVAPGWVGVRGAF